MKQQLIQTSKATILVVDLPEGATDVASGNDKIMYWIQYGFAKSLRVANLPPGQWQLLGKTFDLSEEQWKDILPRYIGGITGYLDYESGRPDALVKSATESGLSLLISNKVFKENPISSEKPITIIGHKGSEKICEAILKRFQDQWQEAEQHVFRNAYTLIKK